MFKISHHHYSNYYKFRMGAQTLTLTPVGQIIYVCLLRLKAFSTWHRSDPFKSIADGMKFGAGLVEFAQLLFYVYVCVSSTETELRFSATQNED